MAYNKLFESKDKQKSEIIIRKLTTEEKNLQEQFRKVKKVKKIVSKYPDQTEFKTY